MPHLPRPRRTHRRSIKVAVLRSGMSRLGSPAIHATSIYLLISKAMLKSLLISTGQQVTLAFFCPNLWRRMKESNHQPCGGGVFKTLCAPGTPSSNAGGEYRIRTYGTLLHAQLVSNEPLSTTQPTLHNSKGRILDPPFKVNLFLGKLTR